MSIDNGVVGKKLFPQRGPIWALGRDGKPTWFWPHVGYDIVVAYFLTFKIKISWLYNRKDMYLKERIMEIATTVYKGLLASSGFKSRLWYVLRQILIKLRFDPICSLSIHGFELKIPLSHQLPAILKYCQYYDKLPSRISAYIHQNNKHLICVDVGANIGDTIASFYSDENDIFLAIEPNPRFKKLLAINWAWNKNITVISDICSSESSVGTFTIQERKNGTCSISKTENGIKMNSRTLDDIVADCPFVSDINVVKIDTDGHDLDVIAGAVKLISKNMPAILFECEATDTNYIDRCMRTLNQLNSFGYTAYLLYDSRGNFLGLHSLSNLSSFRDQLLAQIKNYTHDFEVLIMLDKDIFQFYNAEKKYFTI